MSEQDNSYIAIANVDGAINVETLRQWFESSVNQTTLRSKAHPDLSCVCDEDNVFQKYHDDHTHAAWVGFAIGARAFQRYAKSLARSHDALLNQKQ